MILLMEEILHQLVDRWSIPLFTRFYASQVVVWDFFHQQQYVGHPLYLPWIKVVAGTDANTEQTGIIPACTELRACWGDSPTIQKPTNHHFSPGSLAKPSLPVPAFFRPPYVRFASKKTVERNLPGCTPPKKKCILNSVVPKSHFLQNNANWTCTLIPSRRASLAKSQAPDGASDPTTTDISYLKLHSGRAMKIGSGSLKLPCNQ